MAAASSRRTGITSRSSRMTVSRISFLAALLIAWGAAAQTGDSDRAATAPPRSLSDLPQPPEASDEEQPAPAASGDEDQWPTAASDEDEPPPPARHKEEPPDV